MKQFLIIFFTFFIYSQLLSQEFYDRATVQKIEIFFSFSNWDSQLDAATLTESYLIADSVIVNGVVYDSVGVKYKGNSSYNANNNKNPLHIELDHIIGSQDYQGYTDIKLQNGYSDPSMIREVLSYAILEQYMDCPKANFANVYINGSLRGLYSNAESINKKFNGDNYYLSDKTYFKCNPQGGAGPGSTGSPDLKYINADSSSYFNAYELKTTYGWNKLVDLINTLNNNFSNIESKLDIDRAMWMLAFNNVLVNLDSYNGAFRQNYYLTWDLNDRFVPTVWDLNMSFNSFPGGTGSGSGGPSLDPMSNINSTNHPLIKKILADPMYKRMYMAHIRTIVQEIFANQAYLTTANTLRSTINASVQADPYKFFTYTQFQNSLTTAVTGSGPGGGASIPGIQTLMAQRVTFFSSNANYMLQAPTINSTSTSNLTPAFGENIFITVSCTNESLVYLGYRLDHQLKFNRILMYDDGLHGDGAAGDHVFGAQVALTGSVVEYFIYAENANAGIFSPQRAEHEYHTLSIVFPFCNIGEVVINEVLSSNNLTNTDSNGENDDWLELFNTTGTSIDLSGMYLSDDASNWMKWSIPIGTIIPANGYLLVWCDNDVEQTGLHTNFKLSSQGENVILSNGAIIYDDVVFGIQTTDVSFARCPDGGIDFGTVGPSPSATNNCQAGMQDILSNQLILFPNPTSGIFTVKQSNSNYTRYVIYSLNGSELMSGNLNSQFESISIRDFSPGYYMLRLESHDRKFVTYPILLSGD